MTPHPDLELRLLGELQLLRAGRPLALPPSKKTRALLAYLVVTGRAHRRERLCSLLWDVADDPRGALRWSLSKLRPLVNGDAERLVADRESVEFLAQGAQIDLPVLKRRLQGPLDDVATPVLEQWSKQFRGGFLDGLELTEFHDFQAWCVAEREHTRRMHAHLLASLVQRLEQSPEQALPHAQTRVQIDPLDADARAKLIVLLSGLGRRAEAVEQYRAGKRLFKELGAPEPSVLRSAAERIELGASSIPPLANSSQPDPRAAEAAAASETTPETNPDAVPPSTLQLGELPPIVGRAPLLERVRQRVTEANHACRQLGLLLLGEPGVGKSRVLAEIRATAYQRGGTVIDGRAYEAELGRPHGPWIDALRRLSQKGGNPDAERELHRLQPEPTERQHEGDSRDSLFASLGQFIAERARSRGPVLLLLDDVQWCDEASVALLHYVLRVNQRSRLFVVLAARDGELTDNVPMSRVAQGLLRNRHLEAIKLERLDPDQTVELVRRAMPEADAASVFAQSGGNPLFALEIARAGLSGHSAAAISLRNVVSERIERLPQDAADVVRWAAVLGSVFSPERLEALVALEAEELWRTLETLERHALLTTEGDDYAFAHDVVRNVVYSDLSAPRRRLMHRSVARALRERAEKDETAAAELAHHAALAGEAEVAARACVSAGRRCLRLFANREAEALSRRGLHYVDSLCDEDRVVLTLELLQIQFEAKRPDDLAALGDRLDQLAQRAMEFGRLEHARIGFRMISFLRWEQGAWSSARRSSLAAEFVSRSSDDRERVLAMSDAARCLAILGRDHADAEAMLLEASALARQLGVEPVPLADGIGLLRLQQGRFDEAAHHFAEARARAQREGERSLEFYASAHLVMLEIQRGRHDEALRLAQQLLAVGRKLRTGSELPFTMAVIGLCEYALNPKAGKQTLEQGLQDLRRVDAKYRLAFVLNRAAQLDRARGDTPTATLRAHEALKAASVLDHPSEMALARVTCAQLALDAGDVQNADEHRTALQTLLPGASAEVLAQAAALDAG